MSVVEAGDAAAVSVLIKAVDDDDPALTLDDRHIGQVESADLVDTVGDFVKPVLGTGEIGARGSGLTVSGASPSRNS